MNVTITNPSWRTWKEGNIRFIGRDSVGPDKSVKLVNLSETDRKVVVLTEDIPVRSLAVRSLNQLLNFLNQGSFNFTDYLHQKRDGPDIEAVIAKPQELEKTLLSERQRTLTIAGLGNVGSTFLQGITLFEKNDTGLDEIRIFDKNKQLMNRWELESNQILSLNSQHPKVKKIVFENVFDSDLFAFCIARSVPGLGSESTADVRLSQFNANKEILMSYLDLAKKQKYQGIIAIISDPVDHLTRFAIEYSKPELNELQFIGLGLGIMYARAIYLSGETAGKNLWVTGTHGDLVQIINDLNNFDNQKSQALSQETNKMNISIRKTGYMPYVGPGLSSAALSVKDMLNRRPFWGAIWNGSMVWGSKIFMKNNTWGWMPIGENSEIKDLLIENRKAIDKQYLSL